MHDGSNGITINSLNTIIANAMEKSKLGEASCDEYDIFSPPSFKEEICFDDEPMLVTYSSDHDWEKHTTFDIENDDIESSKLVDDVFENPFCY